MGIMPNQPQEQQCRYERHLILFSIYECVKLWVTFTTLLLHNVFTYYIVKPVWTDFSLATRLQLDES